MYKLSKSQKSHDCRYKGLTFHLLTVILCLMVFLSAVGSKKALANSIDFGFESYRKCYITNISNRVLTVHIWKLLAMHEFPDSVINVSDSVIYPSDMELIIKLRLPACESWYSPIYTPNTVRIRLEKGEYLLSMGFADINGKLDWWKTRFAIKEVIDLPVEIYIKEFCVSIGKIVYFHPVIPLEGGIQIELSNDICIFP